MSYRKRPLQEGWYHCTIRQARKEGNELVLVWTVDRGDHAYRNVLSKYKLNDRGMERLKASMQEIGYIIYEDYTDDFFYNQFTNVDFRANLHIDRRVKGDVVQNVVVERKLPDQPRDYNIKKEKDDSFYNKNNKGRSLPINEERDQ